MSVQLCQSNNSYYDIYYFFKSIYDFSYKTKKNLEKIKVIISNFISIELIEKNILEEQIFLDQYIYTIIPLQILSKNNFLNN